MTHTDIVETNSPDFSQTNIGPAKKTKHFFYNNGIFVKLTKNIILQNMRDEFFKILWN